MYNVAISAALLFGATNHRVTLSLQNDHVNVCYPTSVLLVAEKVGSVEVQGDDTEKEVSNSHATAR